MFSREADTLPPDEEVYRLRREYFWFWLVFTVIYLAVDVVFYLVAYQNADGSFRHPELFAAFSACFWGAWVYLSFFLLLVSIRHRFYLLDDEMIDQGILWRRKIRLKEVRLVDWRVTTRSVVIYGDHARIRIWFDHFTRLRQDRLIALLHATFPLELQKNWKRFDQCRKEPAEVQRIPNRSTGAACVFIWLGFAAACAAGYYYGAGNVLLATAIGSVIAAIWYGWRVAVFREDVYLMAGKKSQST